MNATRWNEIIAQCAAQAIESGNAPTLQSLALKAATLAAEAVTEAIAEEQRLAEDDASEQLAKMKALYLRYLPPDSGISAEQFASEIIGMLDAKAPRS